MNATLETPTPEQMVRWAQGRAKMAQNLIADRAASKQHRFDAALFHGRLPKSRVPRVTGFTFETYFAERRGGK